MQRLLLLAPLLAACASTTTMPPPAAPASPAPPTWAELHARPTRLLREGPAPHKYTDDPLPFGEALTYRSGDLELLAWLAAPAEVEGKRPALLYVHRGFSLKQKDFALLEPWLAAGWVVFAPGFRGENGNPGAFELWKGELDDLLAAIDFLRARPEVDPERIHAFGHSAGGGLVTLLTLLEEPRLASYTSSNGVYTLGTLGRWAQKCPPPHEGCKEDLVRFPPDDEDERRARVLLPNISEMKHPLFVYVGDEDPWSRKHTELAIAEAKKHGKRVEQKIVPGKHGPSQVPALEDLRVRLTGN